MQVVREISGYTRNFRVLALSATPGDNPEVKYIFCLIFLWIKRKVTKSGGKVCITALQCLSNARNVCLSSAVCYLCTFKSRNVLFTPNF